MRGAVELPAVAIFTIVAGGLIVLLFVAISHNQGTAAQSDTQARSLQFLDTLIKTGSAARDQQNNITIMNEALRFTCDDSGVRFGYQSGAQLPLQRIMVFSPYELDGGQLRFFTLGSDVPYRAVNILYLGAYDTVIYKRGSMDSSIDLSKFKFSIVSGAATDKRFTTIFQGSPPTMPNWNELMITPSTASYGTVTWYDGSATGVSAVYPSTELLYGAILSKDQETYTCLLKEYLDQVRFVNEVQWKRMQALKLQASFACQSYYQEFPFSDIDAATRTVPFTLASAKKLSDAESQIAFMNNNLILGDHCAAIY